MSANVPNAAEPMGPPLAAPATGGTQPPDYPQLMGHPRPLWMLFMTEFWERFAFYGIRWALVLYIVAQFHDGNAAGEAPSNLHLRRLSGAGLRGGDLRRLCRRPGARLSAFDPAGRGDHGGRPVHDLDAGRADLQVRPRHHHLRQRPVQAEHLDHGRQAVRRQRRSSRRRLHHLLHGHQPRRVFSRRSSPASWPTRCSARRRCRPTRSCSSPRASACC